MTHLIIKITRLRVLIVIAIIIFILFDFISPDPNRIGTIASILVAAGTAFLAVETWNSVHETAARSEKEGHIRVRPQLAPMSILNNVEDAPGGPINILKLNVAMTHEINVENVGVGVANNIWGVMLPYADFTGSLPTQFCMRYPVPLPVGVLKTMSFPEGGTIFDGNEVIYPGVTFSVPKERAPEQGFQNTMMNRRDRIVARLTLTYRDVFDHKHASIYDLTQMGEWVCVYVLNDIVKDIRDLDTDKGTFLSIRFQAKHT